MKKSLTAFALAATLGLTALGLVACSSNAAAPTPITEPNVEVDQTIDLTTLPMSQSISDLIDAGQASASGTESDQSTGAVIGATARAILDQLDDENVNPAPEN